MKKALVALVLLVATLPLGLAEEGRIPIFEPIVLNGALGDVSGRYVVTRNITATASSPVIQIDGTGTESIDLDLNGFTLTGDANASEIVRVGNVRDFRISNGTLRSQSSGLGSTTGLYVSDSIGDDRDKVTVEDVRTIDGGIGLRIEAILTVAIRRNLISGAFAGLDVNRGSGGEVTGVVQGNVARGLETDAMIIEGTSSMEVSDNRLDSGMIVLNSRSLRFENNQVAASPMNLFAQIAVEECSGCTIKGNNVSGSASEGFFLASLVGCLIEDNVAQNNVGGMLLINGIGMSSGNVIRGNVLMGNSDDGLLVSGERNVVENNTAADNGNFGLVLLGVGHVYRGNVARGNGAPGGGCMGPATCGGADFCISGAGPHTSLGDNLLPGPPPC